MAINKNNILKSRKWEIKSPEEEKIVSSSAELNSLKSKLMLSKNLETVSIGGGGGGNKYANNANTRTGGENAKKQKNKKTKRSTGGRRRKKYGRTYHQTLVNCTRKR